MQITKRENSPYNMHSVGKLRFTTASLYEGRDLLKLLFVSRLVSLGIVDDEAIIVFGYEFFLDIRDTGEVVRGLLQSLSSVVLDASDEEDQLTSVSTLKIDLIKDVFPVPVCEAPS